MTLPLAGTATSGKASLAESEMRKARVGSSGLINETNHRKPIELYAIEELELNIQGGIDSDYFPPWYSQNIADEGTEITGVTDTLRSGWLTSGPKTKRFEQEFARTVGGEFAVALKSSQKHPNGVPTQSALDIKG